MEIVSFADVQEAAYVFGILVKNKTSNIYVHIKKLFLKVFSIPLKGDNVSFLIQFNDNLRVFARRRLTCKKVSASLFDKREEQH